MTAAKEHAKEKAKAVKVKAKAAAHGVTRGLATSQAKGGMAMTGSGTNGSRTKKHLPTSKRIDKPLRSHTHRLHPALLHHHYQHKHQLWNLHERTSSTTSKHLP